VRVSDQCRCPSGTVFVCAADFEMPRHKTAVKIKSQRNMILI
jgi:hypothetical protein